MGRERTSSWRLRSVLVGLLLLPFLSRGPGCVNAFLIGFGRGRTFPSLRPQVSTYCPLLASPNPELEEVRGMRAAEIKKELTALGVPTSGIVDKEDLVKLLIVERMKRPFSREVDATPSTSSGRCYAIAKAKFRRKEPPSQIAKGMDRGPKVYVCLDVRIDGRLFEFLVDSGASPTLISESVRQRLGLPLMPGMKLGGVTAGGGMEAQRVLMYGVSIGDEKSYTVNCDALVLENASMLPRGVDGLLGIRYLQHFGIADFNYRTETLSLFPYDAKTEGGSRKLGDLLESSTPSLVGTPMTQDPRVSIFFVDLYAENSRVPIPAIVDLGSGLSIINWKAAQQLGISATSSRVSRGGLEVWGIDGRPLPVDRCTFDQVNVGGVNFGRRTLGIVDLPAFEMIGRSKSTPVAVLGMDILGSKRVVFDFRENKLYIDV